MFKYFAFVPVVLMYKTPDFDLWFWTLLLLWAGSEVARASFLYHAELSDYRVLFDLQEAALSAKGLADFEQAERSYRLYLESRGAA